MTRPARVCVIGAGPRGTGVVQRLCALARPGELELDVVDPFPPGAGRIWRRAQPDLLWMNSPVSAVTDFGGADGLPSLWEWLRAVPSAAAADVVPAARAQRVHERWFATRPLAGAYYEWVFARAVAAGIDVRVHADRAVDVRDSGAGQAVWLESASEPLVVDAVVLAQGHVEVRQGADERGLAAHADRHGLLYQPPGLARAVELDELGPGETVLLRGLGLTFVDQVSLLSQGRGGAFRRDRGTGRLVYRASGLEPVIYAGSRRGVPHHAKPTSALLAGPPPLPSLYTREAVGALGAGLDFRTRVWPLVVKEILGGYFHELLLGHPDRAGMSWPEFSARLAAATPEAVPRLVAAAAPDPADRYDLEAVATPMAGREFADADHLQRWTRSYLRAGLRRRGDPRHSAELGALAALGSAVLTTLEVAARLTPRSRRRDVEGWFLPLGAFLSSGPPRRRMEELVALSEAGVLRFLGPSPRISAAASAFTATSRVVPAHVVRATGLIEARLAEQALATTADPLLTALLGRGECAADPATGLLAVREADRRILLRSGVAHPRRFATGPAVAAVCSPERDLVPEFGFFAVNDAVARAVLSVVAG